MELIHCVSSVGQQLDIWTSYFILSPGLYSVSTQLSVLPMLNAAQLYITVYCYPGQQSISYTIQPCTALRSYTLMGNSCQILKQLVLLVRVTVTSAQSEVGCKISELPFCRWCGRVTAANFHLDLKMHTVMDWSRLKINHIQYLMVPYVGQRKPAVNGCCRCVTMSDQWLHN